MPNLPPQTHVADCDCHTCGKPVKVKINKNGNAYYFCPWVNEKTGNPCRDQHRWGRDSSQEMQRDYLAARKAHNQTETDDHDETEATPAKVHKQPEPEAGTSARDDTGGDHIAQQERSDGDGGGWGLYG